MRSPACPIGPVARTPPRPGGSSVGSSSMGSSVVEAVPPVAGTPLRGAPTRDDILGGLPLGVTGAELRAAKRESKDVPHLFKEPELRGPR